MVGLRFSRLIVLSQAVGYEQKGRHWLCRCDCGVEKIVRGNHLRRGLIKSCGCLNRELIGSRKRREPYRCLHTILLRSARHRGLECDLGFEEFVKFTKDAECHYCGRPLVWQKHIRHGETTACNLDRKDNEVGYSASNCISCCRTCNLVKSDKFSYQEMREIGRTIRSVMLCRTNGYD
jgi:hypothetical protein